MTDSEYLDWKQNFPKENSPTFIDALKQNNNIVIENSWWLGIENIKYHTTKFPHFTIFSKNYKNYLYQLSYEEMTSLKNIQEEYESWMFYINANSQKSIDRFHFHLVKSYPNWIELMAPTHKQSIGVITKKLKAAEQEVQLLKTKIRKEAIYQELDYVNCELCKLSYRVKEWKPHVQKDHTTSSTNQAYIHRKKISHSITKYPKYLLAWSR